MFVKSSLRIIGILCLVFCLPLLPTLLVSWWYADGEILDFSEFLLALLITGFVLWLPFRKQEINLRRKDGFLIVVIFWVLLGILGSLPFKFGLHISLINALFESVSGLTTTGATILSGLDDMQPSILFYRQELQWFGGMGLIMLAVAILPVLGIGGMSLYLAETPGPMKEEKITPRLARGAKLLWIIYVGMTAVCALAYWLGGMTLFDAICHSFSTISTGGFSTHDSSLGYFHSPAIDDVAIVFMMLGGINFSIHFLVIKKENLLLYFKDVEVRTFVLFVAVVAVLVSLSLLLAGYYNNAYVSIENAIFEVVSVVTSTGFGVDDFSAWPLFLPFLLIAISFIGGCGGSTAGGMKVIRILTLIRLSYREIVRLIHPKVVFPEKVGTGQTVSPRVAESIFGFFSMYVVSFIVLMLLMMAAGTDQVTAFSAIATCMNNLGPGLGEVAQTFGTINEPSKLISIVAMLLGRLELLTVLVLLHPDFWSR